MLFLVVLCTILKARDTSTRHLRVSQDVDVVNVLWRTPTKIVANTASPHFAHFKNVINVVVHPYFHVVDFFERMERGNVQNFWGTVYVAPRGRFAEEYNQTKYPVVDCPAGKMRADRTYECVAQFLSDYVKSSKANRTSQLDSLRNNSAWAKLLDAHPGQDVSKVRGALVHHADFWIKPPFGEGLPLSNSSWSMEFKCQPVAPASGGARALPPDGSGEAESSPNYLPLRPRPRHLSTGLQARLQRIRRIAKIFSQSVEEASSNVEKENHTIRVHPEMWAIEREYCYGPSDLYYLSHEVWPAFSRIVLEGWAPNKSLGDSEGYITNEVVIPQTMLALQMAGYNHTTMRMVGRTKEQEPKGVCWGSANSRAAANASVYKRFSCGHKANMKLKMVKQALLKAWGVSNTSNLWKNVDTEAPKKKKVATKMKLAKKKKKKKKKKKRKKKKKKVAKKKAEEEEAGEEEEEATEAPKKKRALKTDDEEAGDEEATEAPKKKKKKPAKKKVEDEDQEGETDEEEDATETSAKKKHAKKSEDEEAGEEEEND